MNVRLTEAQKKATLSSPESVVPIMQQILLREHRLGRSQEHFWVVGLNAGNRLLFIELIGLGRQNRVQANPPDVFRMAIYKLALKLILVHNHPSGTLAPSAADRSFTDRILKVGEIINIEVLDHLIISEGAFFSFVNAGIMAELKASDTWRVMDNPELQQLQKELEQREIERNAMKKAAKKLKELGTDEATIKKITGLRLEEIREL